MLSFRPAKRSEAKPLIGLYSESGCGKTMSSLLLARGFAGPTGKIGMIETESGRGEAYADLLPGGYDVLPLRDTFSPEAYGEAIDAAEKATLDALIIDSASHEWEGAGGVLSMASQNQAAGMKGVLVWQGPKLEHQRQFMLRLLGTPIPLVILCMRAKYPMKEIITNGKKDWVRAEVVEPKQSDDILYEMFLHGWIDHAHKFHGTKYSRDDLRQVLRDNEPITLETGQRLAAWAKGGTPASGGGSNLGSRAGLTNPSPGATSGGGTGGTLPTAEVLTAGPVGYNVIEFEPPPVEKPDRAPSQDWLDALALVQTEKAHAHLKAGLRKAWGSFTKDEQIALLNAVKKGDDLWKANRKDSA